MCRYSYAYGALEALQDRGVSLDAFEKVAYVSDNPSLMCLASDMRAMMHHQQEVKTAGVE